MEAELANYEAKFNTPFQAAKYGFIDDVILPRDTRRRLCTELEIVKGKRVARHPKKHGNPPC